jgi:predicted PurR-regulated permease PerM
MALPRRRPLRIDLSAKTFVRVVVTVVLALVWWWLWRWVLVFLLGVFLAVALEPAVRWLGRHRVQRAYAAPLLMLLIVGTLVGFLYMSGAALADDAALLQQRSQEFRQQHEQSLPPAIGRMIGSGGAQAENREGGGSGGGAGGALPQVQSLAGGVLWGLGAFIVVLVVAVYLLIDGRRTYAWLAAFAPAEHRPRVDETAARALEIIAAYIRGNLITSALCAVVTWIVLGALGVPASLLLAVLAGVLNLLPVVGLLLSAAPATLLAFTVSPTVGLAVIGFYLLYNLVENYYIQPKVYGSALRLSDLAVIAAFLVGAELGGVLGALVALPLAAMYPAVEQIWIRSPRDAERAQAHRRIEAQPEH